MPEGLTPLTPAYLDQALTQVLENHTFQGSHVLVHCRGGVGRAGLVACCWALKLGLCGWPCTPATAIADENEALNGEDAVAAGDWQHSVTRLDTLRLVERMIRVVRHRRSLKAIETYEQVQFLVDYVEYLRLTGVAGDGPSSSS
jgi:hypothetical protein